MTRSQLLHFYNNDTETVDSIIKEKTRLGEFEDNPDAPGCEAARLFNVYAGKEKEQGSASNTDRSVNMSFDPGNNNRDAVAGFLKNESTEGQASGDHGKAKGKAKAKAKAKARAAQVVTPEDKARAEAKKKAHGINKQISSAESK
eukprot:539043-Alexandrium_andersonii.AAC.1